MESIGHRKTLPRNFSFLPERESSDEETITMIGLGLNKEESKRFYQIAERTSRVALATISSSRETELDPLTVVLTPNLQLYLGGKISSEAAKQIINDTKKLLAESQTFGVTRLAGR